MTRIQKQMTILGLVVLLLAIFGYLFRWQTGESPDVGIIRFQWSWGVPKWITVDRNRDGIVDYKVRLTSGRDFSTPAPFSEDWQSLKCDGFFDLHSITDAKGKVERFEHDADRDGKFEVSYTPDEARAVWGSRECPK